jgi:hypothetical protein
MSDRYRHQTEESERQAETIRDLLARIRIATSGHGEP